LRMRLARALALALLAPSGGCGGSGGGSPVANLAPDPSCAAAVTPVPNEGWTHVPEGTPVSYRANPPASGPHYPVWARYQEHAVAVARPYWVHNLEHGAIVFLYRPDAPPAVVAALRGVFQSLPNDPACGHRRALMTPDPLLPRATAVVAADFTISADCVNADLARDFALTRRGLGPEQVCADGTRP
jgi:Protein of unknown function (DUF3105)